MPGDPRRQPPGGGGLLVSNSVAHLSGQLRMPASSVELDDDTLSRIDHVEPPDHPVSPVEGDPRRRPRNPVPGAERQVGALEPRLGRDEVVAPRQERTAERRGSAPALTAVTIEELVEGLPRHELAVEGVVEDQREPRPDHETGHVEDRSLDDRDGQPADASDEVGASVVISCTTAAVDRLDPPAGAET
jgi:hypothetical protein